MKKFNGFIRVVSYILVAAVALSIGVFAGERKAKRSDKLVELQSLLEACFIGDTDRKALEDGAAAGMVAALGDRWSYYIPADQYDSYVEQMDTEEVIKKFDIKKTVIGIVCGALVLSLLMWGAGLLIALIDGHNSESGYIETYIVEE